MKDSEVAGLRKQLEEIAERLDAVPDRSTKAASEIGVEVSDTFRCAYIEEICKGEAHALRALVLAYLWRLPRRSMRARRKAA